MKVIKRNGQEVLFNEDKIFLAIYAANEEVFNINPNYAITEEQINEVVNRTIELIESLYGNTDITVEKIQDLVETVLVAKNYYYVARAYIRYRYKKEMARDQYNILMDEIENKLAAKNVQNQNANVDEHSFGGRMGEATRAITKKYAIDYLLSDMARKNHLNNIIYIHDLDNYAVGNHNCLSIPFDDLLAKGFNTRQADVRPANSVNTAFQLVAVIFQLQSLQQFGGVSATHLDWTMVPYVRKSFRKHMIDGLIYLENVDPIKDKDYLDSIPKELRFDDREANDYRHKKAYQYAMDMTIKETQQAVEGMYHNLNTLQSRSGNQLPFTSINYGTCTLPEGRMVTKALLEGSIKGIGAVHKTSIFPCGIFQMMKGVNREPGDPNYDLYRLALESTSKRLYPNYANVDWSGNSGYDRNDPRTYFSTMGKRKLQPI